MERRSVFFPIVFALGIILFLSLTDDAFAVDVPINIPAGAPPNPCLPGTCFDPDYVIVDQFDTVTWTNLGGMHTSTSGTPGNADGIWHSAVIPFGMTFTHNMDTPGIFPYYCQIHPWQTATVEVLPKDNPVSIPTTAGNPLCATTLNDCYDPESLTVTQSELVTWTNKDPTDHHTTTSGVPGNPDGFWDSGGGPLLTDGLQFGDSFTLDTSTLAPGTYPYYCQYHPWQVGILTITSTPSYHSVQIFDTQEWNPNNITILDDDFVTWNNADPTFFQHSSVSGSSDGVTGTPDGLWASPTLFFGQFFTRQFTTAGEFDYYDGLDPAAIGTVNVVDQINLDPIPQKIQTGNVIVDLQTFVTDLISPVHLTHNADGSGDVYIVDQPGFVYRADSAGTLQATPFLDISAQVYMPGFFGSQDENDFDERGLLGLAFHPQYNTPEATGEGALYTYHSEVYTPGTADFPISMTGTPDNIVVVTEWRVDPTTLGTGTILVDPTTERRIMTVEEPQFNHEGGMLGFDPDSSTPGLFISFGDGGAADDNADGHTPGIGNGQDESNLLGSIVRIDPLCIDVASVGHPSANFEYCNFIDNPNFGVAGELDEIYANGLRNNWKFSWFEGTMFGADVGQNQIEELNVINNGENYGWNDREGTFGFDPSSALINSSPTPPGMTDPILQYDHDEGISITGGFVYRGSAIPELADKYVFGDFSTGFLSSDGRLFYYDLLASPEILELQLSDGDPPLGLFLKSFGQDESGEIYVLAGTNLGPYKTSGGQALGQVLKIIPDNCPNIPNPGQEDTDGDGVGDACDPNTEITTNTVATDTTFGGDLTVDGASFTIPSGITVEFDFENFKIIIKNPDGKILVELGGKITS